MKTFNVTYTKGHLVDIKTGKRIFLKRGGQFTILGDDNQFEEIDDLKLIINPLNTEDKLETLKRRYKEYELVKVASQGDILVYRIGLSKKTSEDQSKQFLFNAILLEDLYMKSKQYISMDRSNEFKWSLCECLCETTECIKGDAQIIESIQGLSLSNLFSNLVAFQFPMQRSGTCNAFKDFFFDDKNGYEINEFNRNQYNSINIHMNIDSFRESYITKSQDKNEWITKP